MTADLSTHSPEPQNRANHATSRASGHAGVLVLGMHRSETAAFTRTIASLGAELPTDLAPAETPNPLDYSESRELVDINEAILARAGSRLRRLVPRQSRLASFDLGGATPDTRLRAHRARPSAPRSRRPQGSPHKPPDGYPFRSVGSPSRGSAFRPSPLRTQRQMLKARLIDSHLPQFQPIPENDRWWRSGLTERTNTANARPLFPGHEMPNVPTNLGYYDLRASASRIAQAEIAQAYGIEGFFFWHYWFGKGKRLLERPAREALATGKPDCSFFLGWANRTWVAVWHRCPGKGLIEQTYPGIKDAKAYFYALLNAFMGNLYLAAAGQRHLEVDSCSALCNDAGNWTFLGLR